MLNSIIYKFFALLCWGVSALIGMILLKIVTVIFRTLLFIFASRGALSAQKWGELTGAGLAALIGLIVAFYLGKYCFKKGTWFWEFSSVK